MVLTDSGALPVIYNNEISTKKFHSIVWIDEFKFGYIGGKWLNNQLKGKGNVVVLEGVAGTSTSDLRTQGALAAFGPGIKVLARQPASWAYDQAKLPVIKNTENDPGNPNRLVSTIDGCVVFREKQC